MMNTSLYLLSNVLERAYLELVSSEDEQEKEYEDGLYSRLDQGERTYQLHENQRLDISSLDDEFVRRLFPFTCKEMVRITRAMGLSEVISFREESSPAFSWNSVEEWQSYFVVLRIFCNIKT